MTQHNFTTQLFLGLVEEFRCPEGYRVDLKLPESFWDKPAMFLRRESAGQPILMALGLPDGVAITVLNQHIQDRLNRRYVYEHPGMMEQFYAELGKLIARYEALNRA